MRQLNTNDALFLASESAHSGSNVSLVQIYDPSTAPEGRLRFKSILALVESRLHLSPIFRQKLCPVPFGLDAPYWIDDENFDLEYHVRNIALPTPGDWRQFCIQASRIHARPLDPQSTAVGNLRHRGPRQPPRPAQEQLRAAHQAAPGGDRRRARHRDHHAAARHDAAAAEARAARAVVPRFAAERARARLPRVDAHGDVAARLARPITSTLARLGPAARSFASEFLQRHETIPVTRFNTVVSPYRVFETRRFLLDEFREIRRLVAGATVNDAVLAVCAGGLRNYLEANEELPDEDLSALTPVYVRRFRRRPRRQAGGAVGARDAGRLASPTRCNGWRSSRRRPRHRRPCRARSARASSPTSVRTLPRRRWHSPARCSAARCSAWVARAPVANCAITNVPGPSVPLYLNGARMTYFSAIMPINDGLGLVFAVTSYDGKIIVSPTSCREQMPDPEVFAQCVRDAFQDYLALARAGPRSKAKAPARRQVKPAPAGPSSAGRHDRSGPTARTAATVPRAAQGGPRRSRARAH